eukprot:Blabericola_migrator_1__7645@NODE_3901_length_1439_cov_49_498542_g2411_i0_p1_GENE_NODE_3901_length_1439_cov_49_498542_g2411_i0NODE_3901_length_1439_cov_49_498542_g2411_i0_p1_ORF_typecomplete_len109_score5_75_NODE_3901_length_1439_cov_49_498542_g2411_i0171497
MAYFHCYVVRGLVELAAKPLLTSRCVADLVSDPRNLNLMCMPNFIEAVLPGGSSAQTSSGELPTHLSFRINGLTEGRLLVTRDDLQTARFKKTAWQRLGSLLPRFKLR